MGSLSPEQIIALLAAAVVGIALVAGLVRSIAGRRRPEAPANVAFAAPARASADSRPLRPQQPSHTGLNPPVRLATSQAAPQPSYTAIAVAEAARAAPKPAPIIQTKRIDYSNETTAVSTGASYAAIAVAAAARRA